MKKKRNTRITGAITVTASASGYVSSDSLKEPAYIPFQFLNTALNGDEVEISLMSKVPGEKLKGEVVSIIKRKKTRFVGAIDKISRKGYAFVVPDDSKMYTDIFVPTVPAEARNNAKVLVEMKEWEDPKKNPVGRIMKVIGRKGDIDAEMSSIAIEKGFEMDFPKDAGAEAKRLKKISPEVFKKEAKKRRSFEKTFTFTIDPEDAKDFDDAISVKKKGADLYEIGVHIADVSFWVKEGSAIDREAVKRGYSLYLVDRTVPMLPEVLSNDICSLNPGEDKMTFSVVFQITSLGEVKKTNFVKSVINSDIRLSYRQAQNIMDSKKEKWHGELASVMKIAEGLRAERMKGGSLDIDQDEIAVELGKGGAVERIYLKESLRAHYLIEEFMILANRKVASFLGGKKDVCVFRIHEKPDRDSIANLYRFLKKLGRSVSMKGRAVSPKDLGEILEKIKGRDEEFLVKSVMVRSLPKARYSTENKGHFALALEHYAHFTSPIRRYADLMVHRILNGKIRGRSFRKKKASEFQKIIEKLNQKEIDLFAAERESIAYKQTEYMLRHVGENFKGIISGVTEWGIYVQELETRSEGMIKLRNMRGDFYVLDKESFSIVGSRTGRRYSIGDKVKIRVVGGDIDKKNLDYSFI